MMKWGSGLNLEVAAVHKLYILIILACFFVPEMIFIKNISLEVKYDKKIFLIFIKKSP